MAQQQQLDMENRDPNNLNDHLQVSFEDVFGEPEGVRAMDCVWSNSYKCFEFWKGCIYKLCTFLCGLCIAACWGCEFGGIALNHVWCWTPCMRDFSICVGCYQKLFGTCISCCLNPLCEGCGRLFSQITVTKK
ncbi:hypothetical protein ACF0H5_014674 [Mactra antiquata]